MGFMAKLFGYFQGFEDKHPAAKLAAEVGAAVVSHIHGGGTLEDLEAVLSGIKDVIAAHKSAPSTSTVPGAGA